MNRSAFSAIALFLAVLLTVTAGQKAQATSIHIEFSGVFAQCAPLSSCIETPLEVLLDTTFSGEIEIPNSAADEQPNNPEVGHYTFEKNAFMTLNAEIAEFNLSAFSPVTVFVIDCTGPTCFNEEFVWISVAANGFMYALNLGAPQLPFESDGIPPVGELSNTHAAFEISAPGFEYGVVTDVSNYPFDSPLVINFTSVPVPAAIWPLGLTIGLICKARLKNAASHC